MRRFLIASLFIVAVTARGQGVQPPYEKVLVPIMSANPVPGAYGSLWTTELVGRNESDEYVEINSTVAPCLYECPFGRPPHATFGFGEFVPDPNKGLFLYVGSPGKGKVSFNLRVQDVSRQSMTWGTEIPLIREKDVYTSTLRLLDVPVDRAFRSALRVYDFDVPVSDTPDQLTGRVVRVRVYDMCGIGVLDHDCSKTPVAETTLILVPTGRATRLSYPNLPAAAVIGNLVDVFPQLANIQPTKLTFGQLRPPAVRIDIDPVTPGLRFWAFVTATNNETQHVTAITPQ